MFLHSLVWCRHVQNSLNCSFNRLQWLAMLHSVNVSTSLFVAQLLQWKLWQVSKVSGEADWSCVSPASKDSAGRWRQMSTTWCQEARWSCCSDPSVRQGVTCAYKMCVGASDEVYRVRCYVMMWGVWWCEVCNDVKCVMWGVMMWGVWWCEVCDDVRCDDVRCDVRCDDVICISLHKVLQLRQYFLKLFMYT